MTYSLICVSFDGDYITEGSEFVSIDAAWDRSEDMGSRWFFYPFHFVVDTSSSVIVDAGFFKNLNLWKLSDLIPCMNLLSELPELANADVDEFSWSLRHVQGVMEE